MARPQQDAIETFMSITGAPEAVALRKLEENGGDLNRAINAHFSEADPVNTRFVPEPQDDLMAIDDPLSVEPQGPLPLLPSARALNPFLPLDPSFGRSFFNELSGPGFTGQEPRVSHPREVREIPIEFRDGNTQPSNAGSSRPAIEDVTDSTYPQGPEVHGTVSLDDEEEDEVLPVNLTPGQLENLTELRQRNPRPTAPQSDDMADDGNDIEEEMVRAAIEASKREAEGSYHDRHYESPDLQFGGRASHSEDADLAHAVSLSIMTAEQENALREQIELVGEVEKASPVSDALQNFAGHAAGDGRQGFSPSNEEEPGRFKLEVGSSSIQEETEDVEEEPLVRNRSRRSAFGSAEPLKETGPELDTPPASGLSQHMGPVPQHNGDAFHSDVWGGISSEEHDEAVMLEAAMFGGIPGGASYPFRSRRVPRPPSPNLAAQRLLREQQDDEYLASLLADREKELKAKQEAEAAIEQEKKNAEEARQKLLKEEELERWLTAKEASLPQEPTPDDESAVTLLVRMPDGTRRGRRFRKSDKLQFLFDFIDVGRGVKPGSYKLVRPYPRQAFSDSESKLSLSDLGLTSKQEALFLELI